MQLFDWGWDTHGTSKDGSIEIGLRDKCSRESDQAVAAPIRDLKQRGLLDDTLVVWGGGVLAAPHAGKPGRSDAALYGP